MPSFNVELPDDITIRWITIGDDLVPVFHDGTGRPLAPHLTELMLRLMNKRTQEQEHAYYKWWRNEFTDDIAAYHYDRGFADGQRDKPRVEPRRDEDAFWYVYLIRGLEHHKIGISTNCHRRLRELRTKGGASSLHLVATAACDTHQIARMVEGDLHKRFTSKRVHGEWFDLSDDEVDSVRECLADVENITIFNDEESVDPATSCDVFPITSEADEENADELSVAD